MLLTVKQVSQRLGITTRAVQKKCKEYGIPKKGNTYHIPERVVKDWENNEPTANLNELERTVNEPTANEDPDGGNITEEFTQEQYDKLQEVIHHYPELLKRIDEYQQEIKFLRDELQERSKELNRKSLQLDNLIEAINGSIKTLHQSNYIQAKDKGID